MRNQAWLAVGFLTLACSDETDDKDTVSIEQSDTDTDTDTDTDVDDSDYSTLSCEDIAGDCIGIPEGDTEALFEATNLATDGLTIVLSAGTWTLDNAVTLRGADNLTLAGQGMDQTILDFSAQTIQTNGVDAVGDGFTIQDLSILDAQKNGLRVEDSDGVIIRRVRVSWTTEASEENGGYGLYPVRCSNVLVEQSEAFNASDAGIYVGQSQHTIVRNNLATGNVAGIEIENTQYADVYGNTATGNTSGMLIFDLPGNPVVGRDTKVHDNIIHDNNLANFAPGGTVAQIPAGTGMVLLSTRRVEVYDNSFSTNNTTDIAIVGGLAIESNEASWAIPVESVVGTYEDLGLPSDGTSVYTYEVSEVVVRGNTFEGSGTEVDVYDYINRELGFLIGAIYQSEPVDSVLYLEIGESSYSATDAGLNSNDFHICAGEQAEGTLGSVDLETMAARLGAFDIPTEADVFRPPAPFTPFDCTELSGGEIGEITLTVE
jgi:parallel beta-helix repeat protein